MRLTSKANDAQPALDPGDFPVFVLAQGPRLYRTACLLTGGDTHLAEDLVQETLGRVYAKWGQRRRIENPAGYAQTTLVHSFISMRRRKSSSERPTAQLRDTPVDAADIELRVTLLDALARLAELDRAVLAMYQGKRTTFNLAVVQQDFDRACLTQVSAGVDQRPERAACLRRVSVLRAGPGGRRRGLEVPDDGQDIPDGVRGRIPLPFELNRGGFEG